MGLFLSASWCLFFLHPSICHTTTWNPSEEVGFVFLWSGSPLSTILHFPNKNSLIKWRSKRIILVVGGQSWMSKLPPWGMQTHIEPPPAAVLSKMFNGFFVWKQKLQNVLVSISGCHSSLDLSIKKGKLHPSQLRFVWFNFSSIFFSGLYHGKIHHHLSPPFGGLICFKEISSSAQQIPTNKFKTSKIQHPSTGWVSGIKICCGFAFSLCHPQAKPSLNLGGVAGGRLIYEIVDAILFLFLVG